MEELKMYFLDFIQYFLVICHITPSMHFNVTQFKNRFFLFQYSLFVYEIQYSYLLFD